MQTPQQQADAGLQTDNVPSPSYASSPRIRLSLAAAAVLVVSAILPMPAHGRIADLPSVCMFHLLTGHPCPACGLTRSFVCFAHGHLTESLAYHPLGPLFFGALALYAIAPIAAKLGFALPSGKRTSMVLAYLTLTVLLGVWGLRLTGIIPVPANLYL